MALKVLPEAFTADPDRLARFEREAKVLASLNHPNIGSIYGLEEAEGVKALVLELIEGPTLADRIKQGPIPIDEALPIAKQIAEALEAAHEAGVIHRDLKPANIKVRDDGTVKVLDFGLAKALQPEVADPNMSLSPTISLTAAATQMGMVIGTAAYMAPEQAKGKPVDKRADIWAFGAVLYEMLTGQKPFQGEDVSETLATVIKSDPDWGALPADTPPRIHQVMRAALAKQPKQRVHDIADVRLTLEGVFESQAPPSREPVAAPEPLWRRPVPLVVTGLLVAALTGGAGWTLRPVPAQGADVMRFSIPVSAAAISPAGTQRQIAISRDGSQVAYRVSGSGLDDPGIHVRRLDQLDAVPLRGTEGGISPFFDPGGQWIGFITLTTRELKKIPILGGPAVTLMDFPDGWIPIGASWGTDGQIVIGRWDGGLVRIAEGGGDPEPVTTPDPDLDEEGHFWPFVIPDTNAALMVIGASAQPTLGELAVARLDTGEVTRLGLTGTSPRFVDSGHLVFALDDASLRAVPFDRDRLEVTGSPVPLVERVQVKPGGAANFDVSSGGRLVFIPGDTGLGRRSLIWVDRAGTQEPIAAPPRAYTYARLSPDGRRVALDSRDEEYDIWIWDLERETLQRLTRDPGMNRGPVWSPDGGRIAFTAEREGVESIFWQAADGSGVPEELTDFVSFPSGFTPDGARLLSAPQLVGAGDIGLLALDGSEPPRMILEQSFSEVNAQVSPDGRWVAYQSNETGRQEIYVRPFPDVDGALYPVSTTGGSRPRWAADGTELFYYSAPGIIMAVAVRAGDELVLGRPEVAASGSYAIPLNTGTHYDVSPDGQRFLLIVEQTQDDDAALPPQLIMVLNWFEELKERVPVD